MPNHSRNDPWFLCNALTYLSLHSVSFARRGLSICENSSIETFNNTVNNRGRCIVVHFSLFGVAIEYFIEGKFEGLSIRIFVGFEIFDSYCFIIKKFLYSCIAYGFLSLIEWPKSTDNFDISNLLIQLHWLNVEFLVFKIR